MGWFFSRKPPHPLETAGLRAIEARIAAGDRKQASQDLKQARADHGDAPGVLYLEALLYHEGSAAAPENLLTHLGPAIAPGLRFPEAKVLEARLLAACARLDEAGDTLNALGREKLPAAIVESVRSTASAMAPLLGPAGPRTFATEADAVVAELARMDLVIRWRASDLARLDSLLDEHPELAQARLASWTSLLGEIAVRGHGGIWRVALRPEDRAVTLAGGLWPVGRALRERLGRGAPLYESLLAPRGLKAQALDGIPGAAVIVESGVHIAVVADHIGRAALRAGATSVGVFRSRPTPEGPLLLPVSFLDKNGALRVVYIESRPWEPERAAELRRWIGRLRSSVAREAQIVLASAHQPPPTILDLVEGRDGPPPARGLSELAPVGARAGTPRSLDESKLQWIDERAEMMERLVRASLGAGDPPDLELVRKIQQTVVASFRTPGVAIATKHWNALYGYGALYGRMLARACGGRWTRLGDDRHPAEWEMELPGGGTLAPIGRVVDLAQGTIPEDAMVSEFLRVRAPGR